MQLTDDKLRVSILKMCILKVRVHIFILLEPQSVSKLLQLWIGKNKEMNIAWFDGAERLKFWFWQFFLQLNNIKFHSKYLEMNKYSEIKSHNVLPKKVSANILTLLKLFLCFLKKCYFLYNSCFLAFLYNSCLILMRCHSSMKTVLCQIIL